MLNVAVIRLFLLLTGQSTMMKKILSFAMLVVSVNMQNLIIP